MSSLEQMIARMKQLGSFNERAAELAAPLMQDAAREAANAGVDPNGKPWPAKKDGTRALEHAADHVRAESHGDRVDLIVDGPEFWHQTIKEGGPHPQRKLIPSVGDALPPALKAAADEGAARAFAEMTRGQ